jgi:DICT domain-containing protein
MSPFERWFVRRVFAKEVRQGADHPQRLTALYRMITDAVRAEFTEDNEPTIEDFCRERFEAQAREGSPDR